MDLSQLFFVVPDEISISGIVISALLLLLMLFLGSIAAGAEIAFFTLKSKEVNYLKTRKDNTSRQVVQLIEQPSSLLSSIKSMKMLSSVFIVLLIFNIVHTLTLSNMERWVQVLIVIVLAVILLLLVMDIIPKMYARKHNLRMVLFSAPFVNMMYGLFKNFVPSKERKQSQGEDINNAHHLSQEELREAIQMRLGHEPSKEELDIFKGILRFSEVMVKEVMQPRMNISGIREEWDLARVRQKILDSRFSRLPVYKGTIDNIIGIVNSKDLIKYIERQEVDWHEIIRPVFYVHERKLIEDLFQEFQEKRVHMAIVVDEFGGTSGLVTLEDIMEEVVGEIRDEFDEDILNYKKIGDDSYIFEGKILINEFCRTIGVDYHTFDTIKGESTSLAGLVLELAKKFPENNEVFIYEQFEFTVLGIDNHIIERVKVKLLPKKENQS